MKLYSKENAFLKSISSISYPYYDENYIIPDIELRQIDLLAKKSYFDNKQNNQTLSFQSLKDIYNKSPKFWSILKENENILGFIHVEVVLNYTYEKLRNSIIDENDFELEDIIDHNINDEIILHVGSLVIDVNSKYYNKRLIKYFIASLGDKIISLMVEHNVKKVFTVEYKDTNGRSHFKNKLEKYGFNKVGKTKSGNNIYLFDIEKNKDTFFYSILFQIYKKQKEYYKKNQNYINKLKLLFC
ncbi:hypothetical protein [Halarcobacter mediterraneus]|nr:hypothetical protein [Halarcobacter mediterraneus]